MHERDLSPFNRFYWVHKVLFPSNYLYLSIGAYPISPSLLMMERLERKEMLYEENHSVTIWGEV